MKNKMITVFLAVLTIICTGKVTAQRQKPQSGRGRPGGVPPAMGIIKGRVMEKERKIPMEYTNVVLYRLPDSTVSDGLMTGKNGTFLFEKVKPGKYYIAAHFIGFKTKYIGDIKVDRKHPLVNVGNLFLEAAAATLSGVEIKGEQRRVEYRLDKKVINVTKDLRASAGSAVEILENVPSVDVDIEGNVSIRGSSDFVVYIDGKPSILDGNDALQQLPANAIERIEIITNPSAKYDPDGVGGILNIVLKKNKKLGLNGIVNASVSTNNKYRGGILLSYRTGKINWYGGFDGNYRDFNINVHSEDQNFFGDTTDIRITDINGLHNRNGYGLKAGMDYYITPNSTVTLSGKLGKYGFGMENTSKRHMFTDPFTSESYSQSQSFSHRFGNYYQGTADFEHKFDDLGQKLDFMVNYNNRSGDDEEEQSDYLTDASWNDLGETPSKIKTVQGDDSYELRIKADYTKPVGEKGKFEAGYQSRLSRMKGDYNYYDFDTVADDWLKNTDFSNAIDFARNIHGGYLTFGNTIDKFSFQAGIRGEYTYRSVSNSDTAADFLINRFDYFPSLHLSFQFTDEIQFYTSYSRRIRRPRERQLDPFPMIIDPYNIRMGNPELEPEYIDSYELGIQKMFSKSFVSLETYYRVDKNKITRIKSVNEEGITLHTYENLNKDFSLGAELMGNINVVKWMSLNASVNFYNYRLEGNVNDEDVAGNSNNWSGKLNVMFRLKHNIKIQWSGVYRGPTATAQGHREGFAFTNLAVRKDFFKRRLSATISARDLLGTARFESYSEGENFYSHSTFRRESPILTFSLSYIINNYKKKRTPERDDNSDMMDEGF